MKLSIITINFNNLEGLKKTVASVINQTWTDFEWIIVDGGSTDGSKEYIEDLSKTLSGGDGTADTPSLWHVEQFSLAGFTAEDMPMESYSVHENGGSRRLLWCSEPDNGIYNAMNKGIAKASGEYLNFMNSGDCFYEGNILERVLPYLNEGKADVYYGDQQEVYKDFTNVKQVPKELDLHYFLCKSIGHASSFIKFHLLKTEGYREDFIIISDGFAFFKWRLDGKVFMHLNMIVSGFDMSGISSMQIEKALPEQQIMLSDLFGEKNLPYIWEDFQLQKKMNEYQRKEYDSVEMQLANKIQERGGKRRKVLHVMLKVLYKILC